VDRTLSPCTVCVHSPKKCGFFSFQISAASRERAENSTSALSNGAMAYRYKNSRLNSEHSPDLSITHPLETEHPSAVPIIPLPGISLSDFASRHAVEWFHISREKLRYRSQFPPPSQVAITVVYRYPAWAGATISWSRPMSRPAVPIITLLSTTLTDLRLDRHQNW